MHVVLDVLDVVVVLVHVIAEHVLRHVVHLLRGHLLLLLVLAVVVVLLRRHRLLLQLLLLLRAQLCSGEQVLVWILLLLLRLRLLLL